MTKPMEDPPSLVDVLAREHAARRALIEAEAAHVRAMVESASSTTDTLAADTHVDLHEGVLDARGDSLDARGDTLDARGDTEVDIASTCVAADVIARSETSSAIAARSARGSSPPANEIVAPPAHASSPRILVEELSRKCGERRAALDEEARRGR